MGNVYDLEGNQIPVDANGDAGSHSENAPVDPLLHEAVERYLASGNIDLFSELETRGVLVFNPVGEPEAKTRVYTVQNPLGRERIGPSETELAWNTLKLVCPGRFHRIMREKTLSSTADGEKRRQEIWVYSGDLHTSSQIVIFLIGHEVVMGRRFFVRYEVSRRSKVLGIQLLRTDGEHAVAVSRRGRRRDRLQIVVDNTGHP